MKRILSTLSIMLITIGLSAQVVIVTNTNNTGAGSLHQAILDANANAAIDEIKFNIPTFDAGYNAGTGVYTIVLATDSLPIITNSVLKINGNSQKAFTSNSNTYMHGTGGTVGIDALALSKVDGPEIEIYDGGNFTYGISINANNVTVEGLAVSGFGRGWNNKNGNLVFSGSNNGKIEGCVLGARAHANVGPASGNENKANNFIFFDSDAAIVINNYVAFSEAMGGYFTYRCDNANVSNNEFNTNGQKLNYTDGLDIAFQTSGCTVWNNLFTNNGGNGFDTYLATGNHMLRNNTITHNGKSLNETAGVRSYGAGNTYRKNIIHSNYGAGIMITSAATNMTISQNSIYNNGNVLPYTQPWPVPASNQIGIDLLKAADSHAAGASPYYTINDNNDVDAGGNALLNFPVIENAIEQGLNIVVSGFAPAGATIEFFLADLYSGATYPQGKTFLFSKVEGSVDDADAGTGSYGPSDVNGVPQGQESSVNRFSFTVAKGALVSGSKITSTATVSGIGTSEFGGAVTVMQPSLLPKINCAYIDGSGNIVSKLGYVNNTASTITKTIGTDNQVSPTPADRGQGTSFAPGTNNNLFTMTNSGSASWTLNGLTVVVDATTSRCDADLGLTQVVSDASPSNGDNVTFTVTLTNHSTDIPATAIEVGYALSPNFTFVSSNPSSGTYTAGVWSVGELLSGASVTLEITVTVNGSGSNTATVNTQNQTDSNPTNNSASAAVTVGGSSGGSGGGVESNGSLAEKIAYRNFTRQKEGRTDKAFYADLSKLQTLENFKRNAVGKAGALKDYVPNTIDQGPVALVTTPTDLIGITNATNVLASDYFATTGGNRIGVVLALETQGAVYEHTKIVCDRLRGGELTDISTVLVNNMPFVLTKLEQENGSIDYTINFVVFKNADGSFKVDQKWNLGEYQVPVNTTNIYNFQVWTVNQAISTKTVEDILALMAAEGAVTYNNQAAATVPTVYVKKGEYKAGKMYLTLDNTIKAREITVVASKSGHEKSVTRQDNYKIVSINPNDASPIVEVDLGYLFDVDFSVVNNQGGGKDFLYFADGPWGRDWEAGTGVVNGQLTFAAEAGVNNDPDVRYLERDVTFNGQVKNYALIFKQMRAGGRVEDLSGYNQLQFEASATGIQSLVVTVVREGITRWQDQFTTTIQLTNTLSTYNLDLALFTSTDPAAKLDMSDIVSINFNIPGDGTSYKNTTLEIRDAQLNKTGRGIGLGENIVAKNSFDINPNPFVGNTNINFELDHSQEIRIEVYDLSGKMVADIPANEYQKGSNTVRFTANGNMNAGVYLVKLISNTQTKTQRMIMAR